MQNIKKLLLILTFVMGMAGLYGKDENIIAVSDISLKKLTNLK